jgi:hypothetical protein
MAASAVCRIDFMGTDMAAMVVMATAASALPTEMR